VGPVSAVGKRIEPVIEISFPAVLENKQWQHDEMELEKLHPQSTSYAHLFIVPISNACCRRTWFVKKAHSESMEGCHIITIPNYRCTSVTYLVWLSVGIQYVTSCHFMFVKWPAQPDMATSLNILKRVTSSG
jgi:hypothetical protein